jgi:hypothetical protein
MDAEAYRRKARDLFAVAQLASRPEDKAVMLAMAAHWIERAEEVERLERIQQRQQVQPEPEPSRKVVSQS